MSGQAIAWFVLAVLLVIGELMTSTFYLLMAALGLVAGGLAALAGLSFAGQALAAAILAVAGIFGLRRARLGHSAREAALRGRYLDLDVGETLRVEAWSPARRARAQYRGAQWDVELIPGAQPVAGEFCIVEVRGNVLWVAPRQ